MTGWPHVFGSESGNVAASQLDDNFNAAAFGSDVAALTASIAALPSSDIPLVPLPGGSAGVSVTLSRSDHQHPPQSADQNFQTGTSYTITVANDGQVTDILNAASITVTFANNIPAEASGLVTQSGAGQISFTAASGATIRQRQSFTKMAGQWAVVSWYVRKNVGGTAAEIVLSGDMAA